MSTNLLFINVFVAILVLVYVRKKTNKPEEPLIITPPPPPPPPKPKESPVTTRYRKNYITINGNSSAITYNFNRTLHNVKNIELISAIIPKSQYKIQETTTGNQIGITYGSTSSIVTIRDGIYNNITDFLLELNTQIYNEISPPSSEYINILFNNLTKKTYFISNLSSGPITFTFTKYFCRILGCEQTVQLNTTPPPTLYSDDFISASIAYLTILYAGGQSVNNLPASYYNSIPIFPSAPFAAYSFAEGSERVTISNQLYMDIELDNIRYWDGNNILSKIYIEEASGTTYYDRKYPALRGLNDESLKLDKLTLRFFAILDSESEKIPYQFNGMDYSLQLEITTKNLELNNK